MMLQEERGTSLRDQSIREDSASGGLPEKHACLTSRPRQNAFLKPLVFPEPKAKDLSHFLHPPRDVPIVCLFPTCLKTFGSISEGPSEVTVTEQALKDLEISRDSAELGDTSSLEPTSNSVFEGAGAVKKGTCDARSVEGSCELSAAEASAADKSKEVKVHSSTVQFGPKDEWLRHLLMTHKMVIDKVSEVSSLKSYSLYWKTRFSQAPITDFAAVIKTNSTSDASYDPPDSYYLLSDILPEDKQLRKLLQQKRLEAVLLTQQKEREDRSFSRSCLFCSRVFSGNRCGLFQHMLDMHSFNVGQPDNLVFVNEFLDLLQQKLDNLQCLYCERSFRDYQTLKDHMRKKLHKKISSQNHSYDRFYVINYLELGKTWEQVQAEDDRDILPPAEEEEEEGEGEWGDWRESEGVLIFCLFCSSSAQDLGSVVDHMISAHDFRYHDNRRKHRLDFYGQVKAVNYIRRQVHMHCCCFCHMRCGCHEELTQHMRDQKHYRLPSDRSVWDQPQYFFPTFENDAFLFAIDDTSEINT